MKADRIPFAIATSRRSFSAGRGRAALLVAATLCATSSAGDGHIKHAPQHRLEAAIAEATPLDVRKLMQGPESVWDQHMFWAPNRDGKTWDVIFVYSPNYTGPHEVVIVDTGSGEVKRQTLPEGVAVHLISNDLIDGKLYLKVSTHGAGLGPWVYDPDSNEMTFHGRPLGEDLDADGRGWHVIEGTIYGYGHRTKDGKLVVYRLYPKTMTGETFAPIADTHDDFRWLHSASYVDGDWLYLRVGQKPWRLFAYNIKTHETACWRKPKRSFPAGKRCASKDWPATAAGW